METVFLIVLMGAAVYFLMIRPQQKRAKDQAKLMNELAPGSRVMTISGIIGTIKYLGDKQAILEVSPGVEMTIDKRALSTQPVEDEFEYADEDGTVAVVDADVAEPADVVDPEPVDVVEPEPVADTTPDPAEATEPTRPADDTSGTTWDNPPAEKN